MNEERVCFEAATGVDEEPTQTALFTLIRAYSDPFERSLSIPILYSKRDVTEGDTRRFSRRFLLGMFGWEGEDAPHGDRRTLRLFWIPVRLS